MFAERYLIALPLFSTGTFARNVSYFSRKFSLMTSRKPYQLSPEEMAVAETKKAERLKRKQEKLAKENLPAASLILPRPWIDIPLESGMDINTTFHAKVFTWNLLAQCLVRRELFPTSDCLKAGQREKMIHQELLSQDADILCLQEVDRLEKLLPILDKAGYSHRYAAGPAKKHGCVIAFKRRIFDQAFERVVFYDEQDVRDTSDEKARRGVSFKTRNLGLILALRYRHNPLHGAIVATTHLFWHPEYAYERARQAGILMREALEFRRIHALQHWPCFITGDFNCPPIDATYSLLFNQPLTLKHKTSLSHSRVVHASLDPTIRTQDKSVDEENDESEPVDPDRVIINARPAMEEDGLLSDEELTALFAHGYRVRSAYDEGLAKVPNSAVTTFGQRNSMLPSQPGYHEPAYTSYTHWWKSVLDYIFFIDPQGMACAVTGLLAPHRTEDFGAGLPLKGVCGSDHISLAASFSWSQHLNSPSIFYVDNDSQKKIS